MIRRIWELEVIITTLLAIRKSTKASMHRPNPNPEIEERIKGNLQRMQNLSIMNLSRKHHSETGPDKKPFHNSTLIRLSRWPYSDYLLKGVGCIVDVCLPRMPLSESYLQFDQETSSEPHVKKRLILVRYLLESLKICFCGLCLVWFGFCLTVDIPITQDWLQEHLYMCLCWSHIREDLAVSRCLLLALGKTVK